MEEIQKTLLSLIILYPQERHLIFKGLSEKHFTNQYRTIFKECQKLYLANKEIDPVIIVANAGNEYMTTVANLADMSLLIKPSTEEYINILRYNYNKKHAMTKTKELLLKIEKDELNNQEIQNTYLGISKIFRNDENTVKAVNMLQGFTELLDDLEKKPNYYKTGFKKLDDSVLIDKGDMIIIGGRPSMGKTTLASNIMVNMSAKYKVDFFSLETSTKKIFHKIAASGGGIHLSKFLHSSLQDTDYSNLLSIASEYNNYNLNVIEASGKNVHEITSRALEDKADIIFIDYMQLINEKITNPYERVSEISKKLHIFAQKEKVTVFALSQLKRNDNKEPTLSDLRESGQIEQDADVVLLIHNPNPYPEKEDLKKQVRDLIIAKNKNGEVGKINFDFYGGTQKFKETYYS
jgi:replicative DNA helicase